MTVRYPVMIAVAVVVGAGLVLAYRALQRRRADAIAAAGLGASAAGLRRHLPPLLFVAALVLLVLGGARPQATVGVPRTSGTVILAFDVSNSMGAGDIAPSRLAAAQAAAVDFVRAQPDSVDIGVVAFSQGALNTHLPTAVHEETVEAINRLQVAGGTSLGQAILASLTAVIGQPVSIPDPASGGQLPDLGYWGSASIVLLTDG
jgi:Ca-activated chloride channel homolog